MFSLELDQNQEVVIVEGKSRSYILPFNLHHLAMVCSPLPPTKNQNVQKINRSSSFSNKTTEFEVGVLVVEDSVEQAITMAIENL